MTNPTMTERMAAAKAAAAARRAVETAERTPAIRVWIATGTTPVVPAFRGDLVGVTYGGPL